MHFKTIQERHFLKLTKSNANNITHRWGAPEWNACHTDRGSSAINEKSHSTPIKFSPLSLNIPLGPPTPGQSTSCLGGGVGSDIMDQAADFKMLAPCKGVGFAFLRNF